MRKVILLLAVMVLVASTTVPSAIGFYLNIGTPATTYSTGEPILPPVLVFYDVWQDNVVMAVKTPLIKIPTLDNVYGATHIYKLRTHLSDNRLSLEVEWTLVSPLDDRTPNPPGAPSSITK